MRPGVSGGRQYPAASSHPEDLISVEFPVSSRSHVVGRDDQAAAATRRRRRRRNIPTARLSLTSQRCPVGRCLASTSIVPSTPIAGARPCPICDLLAGANLLAPFAPGHCLLTQGQACPVTSSPRVAWKLSFSHTHALLLSLSHPRTRSTGHLRLDALVQHWQVRLRWFDLSDMPIHMPITYLSHACWTYLLHMPVTSVYTCLSYMPIRCRTLISKGFGLSIKLSDFRWLVNNNR